MSLVVSLERFSLASILRGIESNGKTGILKIHRGGKWVELYFRQGQLVCIGPIRSNITLGDRLLSAGIISQQALQEALAFIGEAELSETRIVLTLIDLGHVSHESLYAWAAKEAADVIGVLLTWRTGEFGFEEEVQPPIDRLLIALQTPSLLPSSSSDEPSPVETAVAIEQEQAVSRMNVADPPTLVLPVQFFSERASAPQDASSSFISVESLVTLPETDSGPPTTPPVLAPRRTTRPLPLTPIDISFMTPGMVLIPADLSELRNQNLELELTPEQWQLIALANGSISLQQACLALDMPSERICQIVGELIALGLVTLSTSAFGPLNDASPALKEAMVAGTMSSYTSSADSARSFSSSGPVETVSQWGNGGSNATFVLGGGWVVATPASQLAQRSGPLDVPTYAQAGDIR